MRILYFHQHFTLPLGAGGIRSYEFAKRLINRGHQVTMVCGSGKDANTGLIGKFVSGKREGTVEGIHVIELSLPYSNHDNFFKRSITFLRFGIRAILLALRLDYDLVFATSTPLTVAIPGIFAKIFRKKPFVFEVRDLWPEFPKAMGVITNSLVLKMIDVLETASYRFADACIGLSPGMVEGIKLKLAQSKPIAMIPNGCDLDLFDQNCVKIALPSAIRTNDLVAVFPGAHGIANGLPALLDVAKQLKIACRDDIKLLFVGDGKLKPELIARARKEELDNCIFMKPIPKQEINKLLAAADVGLMVLANIPAFYYSTSPNKFFDFIASGLPVINNYPGWLAEMIQENDCGVVVSPGDAKGFSQALIELADHRELLRIKGDNAKKLARMRFSRDILATQFVDFLEQRLLCIEK